MFNVDRIRADFPITRQKFNVLGSTRRKRLIYFDHGASTHPCRPVLEAHRQFLEQYYANIHRGNHNLSFIASDMFDKVPERIAAFLHAGLKSNVILMTNNTTSALDMASFMMKDLPGDYLISSMEHHSNDLPHRRNGTVHFIRLNNDGSLNMKDAQNKLEKNHIKLLAVTGASNVTGWMPDIHALAAIAHRNGARILVDAAQLLAHAPIDVRDNDDPEHIDFLAAAGHKAYAPFGSAFLFAPREIADKCEPYIPGGGTISYVSKDEAVWAKSPERHEGGTPNIAGAIAFAQSLHYLSQLDMHQVRTHEKQLTAMALEGMSRIKNLELYGPLDVERRLGVISFNFHHVSHELVAAILNNEFAIATRNGCFCAHPYLHFLLGIASPIDYKAAAIAGHKKGLPGAVRVTFGVYNTEKEVRRLIAALKIISSKKWKGRYDLEKSEYCRPVYVKLVSPTCC